MFVVSVISLVLSLCVMINGYTYGGHVGDEDTYKYADLGGHSSVEDHEHGVDSESAKPVAFMVQLSNTSTHPTTCCIIPFDIVKTNVGKHFKPYPGVFVVPFSGTYSFTLDIGFFDNVELAIMANNDVVGQVNKNVKSANAVVELTMGDTVFISVTTSPELPILSHCTFTGSEIFEHIHGQDE